MRRAADFESTTPVATNRSTQDGISVREISVEGSSFKDEVKVFSSRSESSACPKSAFAASSTRAASSGE